MKKHSLLTASTVLICLILYVTNVCALDMHPQKNHLYHIHSNWSIRVTASQGVIIQPVDLPISAEHSFMLEMQVTLNKELKGEIQILSPSESSTLNFKQEESLLPGSIDTSLGEPSEGWESAHKFNYFLQDEIKNYIYQGNLSRELKKMNYEFAIPMERYDVYQFSSLEIFKPRLVESVFGPYKMRLKISIRSVDRDVRMVRINSAEFLFEPERICSGKLWFGDLHLHGIELNLNPLALVIGSDIRLIHPMLERQLCKGIVCKISKEIEEKFLIDHPCVSAIYRDAPVQEMQQACNVPCFNKSSVSWTSPRLPVIEIGDKLIISRITEPIHVKCLNSSHDQVLAPPPNGALEMRIRCGCQLYHKSAMFWSRQTSLPPTCQLDDTLNTSIYQFIPSVFAFLDSEQRNFSQIPKSELESKLFFNISGVIVAEEVLDIIHSQFETQKMVECSIALSLVLIGSTILYRKRNSNSRIVAFLLWLTEFPNIFSAPQPAANFQNPFNLPMAIINPMHARRRG